MYIQVMFKQTKMDPWEWAGYLAGSGNPQRLPPSRESGWRACGSPQSRDSQLRSQISLSMQSPVNTLDMARADDYLLDKRLESMAKVIPLVCKVMHEPDRLPLGRERKNRK
jgi:hypothetical protein